MSRKVFVAPNGDIRFVYSDEVMAALAPVGEATVRRASNVEPTTDGPMWKADMSPVGVKIDARFSSRKAALAWEVAVLEKMGAPLPKEG